jgi:hypothetical protein
LTNKKIEEKLDARLDPFKKLVVRDSTFSQNIEI